MLALSVAAGPASASARPCTLSANCCALRSVRSGELAAVPLPGKKWLKRARAHSALKA